MNHSGIVLVLIQLALILCNAVFACAEIAVISMNENKLTKLIDEGNKRAVRLSKLIRKPARFLATIQVAITLSGFLGSAFAAENFSDPLVEKLIAAGVSIPRQTLDTLVVIVITVLLAYVTLIFGELVPKRIAMHKAEKTALSMSNIVAFISILFAPIVWLLTISTDGILKLIGIDPNEEEDQVSEEEIRMMIDQGHLKGVIKKEENEIIQNVFAFDDLSVDEVATHRTEMCVLWEDDSMETWEDIIIQINHTYFPICKDSLDNVTGILNSQMYLRLPEGERKSNYQKAVSKPYFIPETIKIDKLYHNMKTERNRIAIVLDEYGGVSGMVTIYDLIEQILGDFITEQPDKEKDIEQIDEHTWRIRGNAPINDVQEMLQVELPEGEYDTFNGLIFNELGRIPEDNSSVKLEIGELHVVSTVVRNHRVEVANVSVKRKVS